MNPQTLQQNIQSARARGVPENVIQSRVAQIQQGIDVPTTPAPTQTPPVQADTGQPAQNPQPQQDLASSVGNAITNFLFPQTKKALTTGVNTLTKQQAQQPNTKGNLGASALNALYDTLNLGKTALSPALELASYAVPFGKGGNVVSKFLAPGAIAGVTKGLSEGQVNPSQIVGNAAIGAGGAGVLGGASELLGGVLGGAGNIAENLGNKAIRSQYNIGRNAAQKLSLGDTVNQLSKYGLTNINDVSRVAPQITGENGILSQVVRKAIGQSTPVDATGLTGLVENLASDPAIKPGQDTKFVSYINKGIQSLYDTTGKAPSQTADPLNTFDFIKNLESKAANESDQGLSRGYKMFADELKDRLFTGVNGQGVKVPGAGADNILTNNVLTPEVMQKLNSIHPQLAVDAANSQTIGDLRSLQAPFVRGSIAAGKTLDAASNSIINSRDIGAGILGSFIGGGPGATAAFVAEKAANTNMVKTAIGNILRGAGNVGQTASGDVTNPALQQILGQTGAQGATSLARTFGSNPNKQTNNNATDNSQHSNSISQSGNQTPSVNDYIDHIQGRQPGATKSRQEVAQMEAAHPAIAHDIETAYQTQLGSPEQQAEAQARYTSDRVISSLEDTYNNNGLAKGRIGGPLAEILSSAGFNPNLNTYDKAREAAASQIAQALSDTGQKSQAKLQLAVSLLPKANSTSQEAQQGFREIRQILGLLPKGGQVAGQ